MSGIKPYLKAYVKLLGMMNRKQFHGYYCLEHFVLKHGRAWRRVAPKLPDGIRPMRPKLCFQNAAELALFSPLRDQLFYCEGYATSVIPVLHAWCVDAQGNVIDPTWASLRLMGQEKRQYFGIVFNKEYLRQALLDQKYYGLIDAWQSGWPLLSIPVEEWKHPMNNGHKGHA